MIPGYAGSIMRINLKSRKTEKSPTPESWIKNFLGGRGFVARAFWEEIKPGIDPLGPENKVFIAPGPFSGQFLSSTGKVHMGALSPATGGYGDSNMGGHFSLELKQAGVDLLILEDIADNPVTVIIDDGKVEFRDASSYWMEGTFATERRLKEELGEEWQIAVIGPAAVHGVVFACVQHDFGRQGGRTGVGTVLGSKKVKAIAVRGTKDIPLKDAKATYQVGRKMMNEVMATTGFKEWQPEGTAGVTNWVNENGVFPTRNFQSGWMEGYEKINGASLRSKVTTLDKGCTNCAIPCGKWGVGKLNGKELPQEGPEYESIALLGGNLGIDDIEAVAYLNGLCDDLGMDSISAGSVVAWTMEAFEKGLLSAEEIGRPMRFGDAEAAAWLLEQIAYGKGFGAVLAQGVKRAAAKVGRGTERFAMHVKGLEISGYEARYAPAMMLSYMTADIGGHHNRSWGVTHDIATGRDNMEGKAERVIFLQHIRPLFDTLGVCRFPWVETGIEPSTYADLTDPIMGIRYTWDELLGISERIWNLTRMLQFRHIPGFGRTADYPPPRWMEEGAVDGPVQGKVFSREQIEWLLDRYYELRGWDKDGRPTPEKLKELGLEFTLQ